VPARVRVVLAVLAAALVAPAAAGAGQRAPLQQQLERALEVSHGTAAAAVVDLATGETVFSHDASRALAPASNEKLGVTYAALTALGPDFRFETDVLGQGSQTGSTWQGDLVLKGYGDPTLSTADLASLARQVVAAGITRVTGRVLGDESWFDARRAGLGWKSSYYLVESPALSALIVNRGWIGHGSTTQPALAATEMFRRALVRAGVHVAGTAGLGVAAPDAEPLADVESASLSRIVRFMDVWSDNFTAEMLLKQVGAVQGAGGSAAAGIAVELGLLQQAGVPLAGVRLMDGSGLSLLDRWTPTALVALLHAMWQDPTLRPRLVASLPVAGVTGTLHNRMTSGPAHGVVRAKTGTTSRATALSGFVGDRYAFSVLVSGWPVSYAWSRLAEDRFAQALAAAR
jgi:D-alanyl-D-alanine carboxypeptidase/D-alanyl-D-alanine-endopeptidase (penicillin-binding protein 4)